MTEGAQYDHIGSKYDEYARTATLKRAESYTFFRMVGPLCGKSVMDLACGFGFYTRLLKQRGAAQVVGVDISPDILLAATDTVEEYGLQAKLPHLTLVRDMSLGFLPDGHFTVVHAHSVFSHSPIEVIDECLRSVRRVMAPDGFFDFTFDRTEGAEHHVLHEDFYYRTETLVALAGRHGLQADFMDDWAQTGHEQSKLRVTHQPG